jgi:uncharacterized protein
MSYTTFKVVVTGPFGAGKTTFINAVSDTPVLQTETAVSDQTASLKDGTTVALDYGSITIDGAADDAGGGDQPAENGVQLLLFGTPGQARFDFMWQILAQGADGYVLLVDASREQSIAEARAILAAFSDLDPDLTFVVGANRITAGPSGATQLDRLAEALQVAPEVIVAVDVLDDTSCVDLLLDLLERVLEQVDVDLLPEASRA